MVVADSYAQSMLVLEQCLCSQPSEGQALDGDNSRGIVLMAMSTLLSERWFLSCNLVFFSYFGINYCQIFCFCGLKPNINLV